MMIKHVATIVEPLRTDDYDPTGPSSNNSFVRSFESKSLVDHAIFYECVEAVHKPTYSGCIKREDAKRVLYYDGITADSRNAITDQLYSMKTKEVLFGIGFRIGSSLEEKVRSDLAEEDEKGQQAFQRWEGTTQGVHFVPMEYTGSTPMHSLFLGVSRSID